MQRTVSSEYHASGRLSRILTDFGRFVAFIVLVLGCVTNILPPFVVYACAACGRLKALGQIFVMRLTVLRFWCSGEFSMFSTPVGLTALLSGSISVIFRGGVIYQRNGAARTEFCAAQLLVFRMPCQIEAACCAVRAL